jgi:DNA-binding transcriptional LysR family regulator
MELFQVRYFLSLAKTLNFTRAAEACNVSQPALTCAIQRLEEEVGGPLLCRERNLTQLTQLGRALLPHLEAAYAAAEAAAQHAAAFKRRDSAPLRLGLDSSLPAVLFTPVMRELQARLAGFNLDLSEGGAEALAARLLDGTLDTVVLVEPEQLPERLNRWLLFKEFYVVICPAGHPFAALDTVPADALGKSGLLARSRPGCDVEAAGRRLMAEAGGGEARHSGGSEDQIQQMVAAGLGVTLAAARQPTAPGLVARPLAGRGAERRVMLAAVAGRQHGPGVMAFLKLMRARDWSTSPAKPDPQPDAKPDYARA